MRPGFSADPDGSVWKRAYRERMSEEHRATEVTDHVDFAPTKLTVRIDSSYVHSIT
jgi:hypothetical protein